MVRLAAVISPTGEPLIGDEKSQALCDFWKKTFAVDHSDFPAELAERYEQEHLTPLQFGNCPAVEVQDFEHQLRRSRNSAPGPDGIGFSAWRHAGGFAAESLALAAVDLAA